VNINIYVQETEEKPYASRIFVVKSYEMDDFHLV